MWIRFRIDWQDGLYRYQKGMVVEIPTDLALRYVDSGKASKSKPPQWAIENIKKSKSKLVPSARRRIKKMNTQSNRDMSISEMADNVFEED